MDKIMAVAASRFGYGPGPQDELGGDAKAWLKGQLQGDDPGLASGAFAGLLTGAQAVKLQYADAVAHKAFLQQTKADPGAQAQFHSQVGPAYRAEAAAQINFATTTPASFRERLVWFWANHFSVSALQNQAGLLIGPMLREAIRPHVTGYFTDMVLAVERHPAMLRYLDNASSIGPDSPAGRRLQRGLNENLGRECMELHTVGLAAGYSQADVIAMAKILTGWGIAPPARDGFAAPAGDATGFLYRPRLHQPGPQTVLGHSFDGGEQAGVDALTFLSTYPATYQLLARKLAVHFVADDPPPQAVAHIAGVLRDSKGHLGRAAAALVDLPQAWQPGRKLKTPFDYVVSALRAAPAPPAQKPPDPVGILAQLGQPVWSAPLPNGWPDQAADWAGADAVMARIDWAYTYAGRFNDNFNENTDPMVMAQAALGPLLRPETQSAMAAAGSPREALTLFMAAPEFQRR